MMDFNAKLTRHQGNLDNAHDALLDAGDREALERESFENLLLADTEIFGDYAKLYIAKQDIDLQSFLDWCWEARKAELTPDDEKEKLRREIDRLNSIIGRLMDRTESLELKEAKLKLENSNLRRGLTPAHDRAWEEETNG